MLPSAVSVLAFNKDLTLIEARDRARLRGLGCHGCRLNKVFDVNFFVCATNPTSDCEQSAFPMHLDYM